MDIFTTFGELETGVLLLPLHSVSACTARRNEEIFYMAARNEEEQWIER